MCYWCYFLKQDKKSSPWDIVVVAHFNGVIRMLKKLRTSKEDYWIKQRFSSIASLFQTGMSLKGTDLRTEGANSFL